MDCKLGVSEAQIDTIITELNYFGTDKISFSEFLTATLDLKHRHHEERISQIFHQFDISGTGHISKENIVTAMHKMGRKITGNEIDKIMKDYDEDHNGMIEYYEFEHIFT